MNRRQKARGVKAFVRYIKENIKARKRYYDPGLGRGFYIHPTKGWRAFKI